MDAYHTPRKLNEKVALMSHQRVLRILSIGREEEGKMSGPGLLKAPIC